ncbi:MAG TPA: hypothetical protein VMZ00_10225 [Sporichthya sp.]|nr:hypothetical protein [Sporichthya sp.]
MPKAKVKFADPANPSPAEVRAWAKCNDLEPMEDWDLVLADLRYADLLVELVADESCPSRRYLLTALYGLVGNAVRNKFATVAPADLEAVLATARATGNSWAQVWAERSAQLIANPTEFDYALWCAGGLAKRPMN